jgi:hypothetical protein
VLGHAISGPTALRALIALIIALASSLPAAAVTINPAVGSSGDVQWDDHCPTHNYLIGLKGHVHEEEINQMQIVCAPIQNGMHGTKYYGPSHGGGGTIMEQSCPRDAIAVGVHVFVHRSEKNRIDTMPAVVLVCRKVSGAGSGSILFSALTPATLTPFYHIYETDQACSSDGETASGLNGHSGKIVNAIGLDCAIRTEK